MNRRGFSFLEILVAVAILALTGLAVVGAVSNSAREVKTTGEYSLSMFLSQKITEDLLQSSHENPYYQEALAETDGLRIAVAGSVHPYFAAVEDSRGVEGRLEPGTDLGVEPIAESLFRLYREFNLTVSTTDETLPPTSSGTPHVRAAVMQFDWPGLKGVDRDYQFPVRLQTPQVIVRPYPLIAQDLPGMETEIRKVVYPSDTGSLSTAVSAHGGDFSKVSAVGTIAVLANAADTECVTRSAVIAPLEAQIPTTPDAVAQAELRIRIAGLYERNAATRWYALLYAKPLAEIKKNFKAKDFDASGYSSEELVEALSAADELYGNVVFDIATALHHYTAARALLGNVPARMFRAMTLERKILELLKLHAMITQPPNITYLRDYQDALIVRHSGRSRAFTDFLTREKAKTTTLAAIRNNNDAIRDRVTQADQSAEDIADVTEQAKKELLP